MRSHALGFFASIISALPRSTCREVACLGCHVIWTNLRNLLSRLVSLKRFFLFKTEIIFYWSKLIAEVQIILEFNRIPWGVRGACVFCVDALWSSICSFLTLLYDGGSCRLGHECLWGHTERNLSETLCDFPPPWHAPQPCTSCLSVCLVLRRGFNVCLQRLWMNLQSCSWVCNSSSRF